MNKNKNKKSTLRLRVSHAWQEGRRLVAPLMGLPGLQITGRTIKLAQQNILEHEKAISSLVVRYQPDIIFSFMDLSIEANALGCYTVFPKNEPPTITKDNFTIDKLPFYEDIDITYDTRLTGYVETVRRLRRRLPEKILLGAYVTAPYTLAGMIMGVEEAAMATIMQPDDLDSLCHVLSKKTENYAHLLVDAGADAVCFLDPTAVMLGPEAFLRYAVLQMNTLLFELHDLDAAWLYHICGNSTPLVHEIARLQVDGVSLDSLEAGVDLPVIAKILPEEMIIFGNLHPTGTILTGEPASVESEVNSLLQQMDSYPNFVLSTGCDLPKKTPLENLDAFMKAGRQYRKKDPEKLQKSY